MLKSFIGSGLGLIFVFQTEAKLLKCTSKIENNVSFSINFFWSRQQKREVGFQALNYFAPLISLKKTSVFPPACVEFCRLNSDKRFFGTADVVCQC